MSQLTLRQVSCRETKPMEKSQSAGFKHTEGGGDNRESEGRHLNWTETNITQRNDGKRGAAQVRKTPLPGGL